MVAGLACYWGATGLKRVIGADDALDVFGVHGVGGIVGALMTGWLADAQISGSSGHVLTQALGVVAVLAYSAVVTALILWACHRLIGLRVDEESERVGLDLAVHRERLGG